MLRQSRGQIFLFAAEKTGVLHPLWLMDSQVPGSIFPCGKNLHPAAKVATLTAPFSPFLRLRRKRKLIEKPISLPFSFYQYTGRTASATYWQTVGFMQGVPPAPPPHPKADSCYAGAGQGLLAVSRTHCDDEKSAVLWVKYNCSVTL